VSGRRGEKSKRGGRRKGRQQQQPAAGRVALQQPGAESPKKNPTNWRPPRDVARILRPLRIWIPGGSGRTSTSLTEA